MLKQGGRDSRDERRNCQIILKFPQERNMIFFFKKNGITLLPLLHKERTKNALMIINPLVRLHQKIENSRLGKLRQTDLISLKRFSAVLEEARI